jgi:3-oxoacyl-[acyl-carrier protein] reductase
MQHPLAGKRAVVGGGSQGIGRAAAQALAELGAEVLLLARNPESLAAAVAALPAPAGQKHRWLSVDNAQPEDLATAVAAEVRAWGDVHILVNNTGGPAAGPVLDASPEAFLSAFTNHLLVNQRLAQVLVPGMKKSGYGRIVNVISTSVKAPLHGLGVSNTVRAAVGNWAKTLATELAPDGITVNNVLPGATATERLTAIIDGRAARTGRPYTEIEAEMKAEVPMGRFAAPSEIAAAVAFLASPAASYITGINIPVDGGRTPNL